MIFGGLALAGKRPRGACSASKVASGRTSSAPLVDTAILMDAKMVGIVRSSSCIRYGRRSYLSAQGHLVVGERVTVCFLEVAVLYN